MADWATISSFATAGGTLVLAIATFWSVRSANHAARTAERALQAGLRPVVMPSRLQDPAQKMMWADRHWAEVGGGRATMEVVDGTVYMAMSLRNVGAGLAVLHGWYPYSEWQNAAQPSTPLPEFRPQRLDLYIPAGDTGLWLAALRRSDAGHAAMVAAVQERRLLTMDLLFGDHEGGQRTITRLGITPADDHQAEWYVAAVRHWNLDRPDPRELEPALRVHSS